MTQGRYDRLQIGRGVYCRDIRAPQEFGLLSEAQFSGGIGPIPQMCAQCLRLPHCHLHVHFLNHTICAIHIHVYQKRVSQFGRQEWVLSYPPIFAREHAARFLKPIGLQFQGISANGFLPYPHKTLGISQTCRVGCFQLWFPHHLHRPLAYSEVGCFWSLQRGHPPPCRLHLHVRNRGNPRGNRQTPRRYYRHNRPLVGPLCPHFPLSQGNAEVYVPVYEPPIRIV
mmetsp:Transcript_17271/g.29560  ORF Transcript_17271/g.29560 Transcript_17271/m.29560 type:complete len:226 (+) Transcript_17271:1857-2534(+)